MQDLLVESGIQEIRNPSSTDKKSGIQYLVTSIQDHLGFLSACVQTPLPSGKLDFFSPIFPDGRGVCTQARFL